MVICGVWNGALEELCVVLLPVQQHRALPPNALA